MAPAELVGTRIECQVSFEEMFHVVLGAYLHSEAVGADPCPATDLKHEIPHGS